MQLFSSIYGMLPSAKKYLIEGGFSRTAAAYALIGLFLAGVVGIQLVSRFLHQYIPSHVVDCDHNHEEAEGKESDADSHSSDGHGNGHYTAYEDTPLLEREDSIDKPHYHTHPHPRNRERSVPNSSNHLLVPSVSRRPSLHSSLHSRLTQRVSTFVTGGKASCDEGGPCHGYSDPCGQECYKIMSSPTRSSNRRSFSMPWSQSRTFSSSSKPPLHGVDEENGHDHTHHSSRGQPDGHASADNRGRQDLRHKPSHGSSFSGTNRAASQSHSSSATPHDHSTGHHHHVPTNAFLSIGLQTSIAIALHKLPEGFITYATNHANPKLGFTVFMALFIHNITEGFAMALPLYLALGSRLKAIFWSSLLGGLSQPLGAGVAAIWFCLAGHTDMAPGERVYGCMFAVTAGIMASVALQLYSESLALTHNRTICTTFAFVGIGILGLSFALTAD